MPEVTVRDAGPDDAAAIAGIWAAAVPYLVRSPARAASDLTEDATLGRRRWVGLLDGRVSGTATARAIDDGEAFVAVEVRPDLGSRGVGTALLRAATASITGVASLVAVCNDDPVSMAFGVRHGFLPEGEHRVALVDPATVPAAGPPPEGLTATSLDRIPDLEALLATHNAAAADDPSGLSRQFTLETFRADGWDGPDNAPELSWALLDESAVPSVVASFTVVQVDRAARRAWSAMTATSPSYRGRGLATWVKRRALNGLADARIGQAWTANDIANAPMLAVNEALGYRPAARSIRLRRRLPA